MNNHTTESEQSELPKSSEPKASTPTGKKRKPKRSARRQAISLRTESPPEHDPSLPHWLPGGDDWDGLPKSVRQAVPHILAPAYRRFVLEATDELQRSFGLTLVHLMWLELCDQAKLVATADPNSLDAVLGNAEQLTERHLHLVSAKCQTAELMVKLRLLNETLETVPLRSHPQCTRHAPCAESGLLDVDNSLDGRHIQTADYIVPPLSQQENGNLQVC